MAYGKSREYLKANNFEQQAKRSLVKPKRESRGAPSFINAFKPSIHKIDKIRLLPGQYPTKSVDPEAGDFIYDEAGQIIIDHLPYITFTEHFHGGRRKFATCSAGPLGNFKGKGDRCIGCEWFWHEWRVRKDTGEDRPKSMSKRDMWAFSVLVQSPFHKVEDTDQDGQPRMNPNTNTPYYHWVMCEERGCKMCAAGKETKQGHVQHWPLGRDHFNTLIDYSRTLSSHCRLCGSQESIAELAWVCGYENCGDAVIDMSTTSLSNEQIAQMTSEPIMCPTCRRITFLTCMFDCSVCSSRGNRGERATLFDVDLKIKRVEDPSGESNKTTLSIIAALGPKPIDSIYGEDLRKPLDLPRIYSPTSLERQASLFDIPPSEEVVARQPVINQYT